MITEALDWLERRATQVVPCAHSAAPGLLFFRQDGKVTHMALPPPRRHMRLHTLEAIKAVVEDPTLAPAPELYYSRDAVVGFLDRNDRRDTLHMSLCVSARFRRLAELTKPTMFSQKNLYKLLRFELAGCGLEALCLKVQRLDFQRRSGASYEIGQGQDSLGSSREARAVEPPEDSWKPCVPVYSNDGLDRLSRVFLELGLFVDADAQELEVRIAPDEITTAFQSAEQTIGTTLRSYGCPVFNGGVVLHEG